MVGGLVRNAPEREPRPPEIVWQVQRPDPLRENAAVPPFVGRADALTQLQTVSDGVLNARGGGGGSARVPLMLVTGEAGMGKTSLLQRYAADVAKRGARTVWGTCWDGDQAPALWPWTQVVRTLLDQDNDEDAVIAELAVVMPERMPPERPARVGPATTRPGCGCSTRSGGSSPGRRPGGLPSS